MEIGFVVHTAARADEADVRPIDRHMRRDADRRVALERRFAPRIRAAEGVAADARNRRGRRLHARAARHPSCSTRPADRAAERACRHSGRPSRPERRRRIFRIARALEVPAGEHARRGVHIAFGVVADAAGKELTPNPARRSSCSISRLPSAMPAAPSLSRRRLGRAREVK